MKVFTRQRINMRPSRGTTPAGRLTHCSIHHGGPVGAPKMTFDSAAAEWRSYQRYHMDTHGWNDIGYNLGVDGRGRLYQGRPVGALPAAVGGHNTGSVAIVFLQDGRYHKLRWRQRRTLKKLFKHGCRKVGLPPLRTLRVYGHQEYAGHESNACPGRHIMRHLRWRRGRY